MTVAYFEEPRRPYPRRGPGVKVCSQCGKLGHQRNSPEHRITWSEPDADGRQMCVVCDGSGQSPTARVKLDCLNCDGEGYRWV